MATNQITWLDDIITSFRHFGGTATIDEICTDIRQRRERVVIPPSMTLERVVYRIVSNHSSDAIEYNGNMTDLFYAVNGSIWGLRDMPTKPFVMHYALDLETPPLIACEHPDPVRYSTIASEVTCPDCMTHEEFPSGAMVPKVTAHKVLAEAASLLSEKGENPEYDRAIIELTSALMGAGPDDRLLMTRILRALSETEH